METKSNFDYEDNSIEKGTGGEDEQIDYDIRKCKFSTYGGDFTIRQLMYMLKENEIETPKIQRNYVWTNKEASRFIESILLDLPIPSIFLAKNEESKFIIVDGLQRLTTLYKYTIEETKDGKTFKISTSKDIRSEWRGKAFRELTVEDQRRINNKLLHSIIVEQKEPTDFDGLFLIFERINTGGVQLNQQEIRNAIFQYPVLNMLHELNCNVDWRKMFGLESPHSRMRDEEMILRFFALESLSLLDYQNESINMVHVLNEFMKTNRKLSNESLQPFKDLFTNCIEVVYRLYGPDVFRTNIQNHQVSQKFYATVYDAVMLATTFALNSNTDFNCFKDSSERLRQLFYDEEFLSACNAHTTEKSAIITRVSKACKFLYDLDYERRI